MTPTRSQPELFRQQARACAHLGSPMYGELLAALADDLAAGGPTARVVRGHEDDPGPSALALRLVGSLHRLVLAGAGPELEAFFPTVGGAWEPAGVGRVLAFLDRRGEELRPLLDRAPQTNEVGRAAALLGGLLRIAERSSLPVRLFEIGASGGLNLQADRFRVTTTLGGAWGDPGSPVALQGGWVGEPVGLADAPRLTVVERGGCDVHPVDVGTEDGRLTLTSYVWPDMGARHERLAGAIELARRHPVPVVRADAASYVAGLRLEPGTVTVLWHSVMWQYVPPGQQQGVTDSLASLGTAAGPRAPLVRLSAEPVRRAPGEEHRFWVCAQAWPGELLGAGDGERVFLGRMAAHGVPVEWE